LQPRKLQLDRCVSSMGTEFAKHAEFAFSHGFTHLFRSDDGFTNCLLTGRRWKPRRGGVYFWIATNRQVYVGKAASFHGRLRSHLQRHRDVKYAFFKPVAKTARDDVEKWLIRAADGKFAVRNIKHAAYGVMRVPFDEVVPQEERLFFLENGHLPSCVERSELSEFYRRQLDAFQRFSKESDFNATCMALQEFISRAIPRPLETEAIFWSVTLNPAGHLLRVNVGQQEVFTITRIRKKLWARIFTAERKSLFSEGPIYETESYVSWVKPNQLSRWLKNARLQSVRELVVGLMRQSNALNYKSHCPQLIEAALRHQNVRHPDV
jgi:hypothetical protein